MIEYDAGKYGLHLIFKCKGSVFPKALLFAVPCATSASILHYILTTNEAIKDALGIGDNATSLFGGFNFVLGFLVVFRAQLAYNRWWEGGTLLCQLRGVWFDSYSLLISYCNAEEKRADDVLRFRYQLVRLYSLMYVCALAQVSPNADEVGAVSLNTFELINLDGIDPRSLQFLKTCPDMAEVALQWIQRLIVESEEAKIIKIAPPILSRVYDELGNGIVNLNNARKIKDFPFPFPMAQMTIVMLCFHALSTPLCVAVTVQSTIWAGVITFVVCFCFWSVLYIALELEMPYGDDPNDLPLYDMAIDFNQSLRILLDPLAHQVPPFNWAEGKGKLKAWDVDLDSDLSLTARSSYLWPPGTTPPPAPRNRCASNMRPTCNMDSMDRQNSNPLVKSATTDPDDSDDEDARRRNPFYDEPKQPITTPEAPLPYGLHLPNGAVQNSMVELPHSPSYNVPPAQATHPPDLAHLSANAQPMHMPSHMSHHNGTYDMAESGDMSGSVGVGGGITHVLVRVPVVVPSLVDSAGDLNVGELMNKPPPQALSNRHPQKPMGGPPTLPGQFASTTLPGHYTLKGHVGPTALQQRAGHLA